MEKSSLKVIILLIAFSQGISTALEGNDQLIRNKRVVHPNINAALARYPVSIARNREHVCGGAVLAVRIVITAAFCVIPHDVYVLSGSKNLSTSVPHRIIIKEIHSHYNPDNFANNLALLVVFPNITLGTSRLIHNRPIQLFTDEIRSGFVGVLSGWGSPCIERTDITYSECLKSIHVQVLTWQDCTTRFGNEHDQFTNLEFCTYDPQGYRRSGYNDAGSPLAVHGLLLGILSWAKVVVNRRTPDVYTNLALPIYREWINHFVGMHSH